MGFDSSYEQSRGRTDVREHTEFEDFFPSESAGRGNIRKNNLKNGSAQGKGSFILKADCRICGYMIDLSTEDHSGGSLDGNGAGGAIALSTSSVVNSQGVTYTEKVGTQTFNKGGGCPLCFSRNSTPQRQTMVQGDPWSRVNTTIGF